MRLEQRILRIAKNPLLLYKGIVRRINQPRPEDYLPFSTTHQHKPTWRWPFLALCAVNIVMAILVMLLLGQQAQFQRFTEDNRETMCEMLEVIQQQNSRELARDYQELNCASRR